jgi:hypothetical protein
MVRFGINDSIWSYNDGFGSPCTYPLHGHCRWDSIDQIRLNYRMAWFSSTADCEQTTFQDFDKFRFFDDIIIFDTAYGENEFNQLYNFPNPPNFITAKFPTLQFEQAAFYYHNKEDQNLIIHPYVGSKKINKVSIYNFTGACLLDQVINSSSISVGHLPDSPYLIKAEFANGEILVNRWIK